jgi:copper chaperone CopZ
MQTVRLTIEHAGCESCAGRVRAALEPLVEIETITIDESADSATVVVRAETPLSREAIDAALADASVGSGHAYRLRAGSLN